MKNNWSGKPYRAAVLAALKQSNPATVLDIACGSGWLYSALDGSASVDGIDFYQNPPKGYRNFFVADINQGVPEDLPSYDAIVCCEAIAYLENPGLFLRSIHAHLNPGGLIVISSPNPNYAGARLHFLLRGSLPGFSHFVQNKAHEAHMPWLALAWSQFWLLLGLAGFENIQLHEVDEQKPKHLWEFLIGLPCRLYCKRLFLRALSEDEMQYWKIAGSSQAIYGRRLVVSATKEELSVLS